MLNGALFFAFGAMSLENGTHTDMQAIPTHIALGIFKRLIINIAVETVSVNFKYQLFLEECISYSCDYYTIIDVILQLTKLLYIEFSKNIHKTSFMRSVFLIFIKNPHTN